MTRVVVVSGGGTGIGYAVAEAFAGDGDQVVLIGRRAEVLDGAAAALAATHPAAPPALAVTADLADPAAAERAAGAITGRFDRVDVVVAAAGGVTGGGTGPAEAARHWEANFRANTLTAVLLTESLKERLTAPGGRVVLISSIAAVRGSGNGSYGGAKAALHPYAYDLSAELGPRGITVNVVAPGYTAGTEFFGAGIAADRERTLVAQTHTGRPGLPEDVARTVHWLGSPAAGQITAQVVQVNGGAERGR